MDTIESHLTTKLGLATRSVREVGNRYSSELCVQKKVISKPHESKEKKRPQQCAQTGSLLLGE